MVAARQSAPAALEILAQALGGKILRAGRGDEAADKLFLKQRFMRDGIFAAVKIVSHMARRGETLASMRDRIPDFCTVSRELPIKCGRGAVMRALSVKYSCETASDMAEGLTLDTAGGRVSILPCRDRAALRIRAECLTEAAAESLLGELERRAEDMDFEMSAKKD